MPRRRSMPACPSRACSAAEWQLEGEGPWELGDDVQLIFTPGHTAGCVSLLYRPDRALFTGDHLAYSYRLGRLTIFRCALGA
jgi:glyoxylase-like metal-dependent hydrolase (beta-lactamase superfamily II)